MADLRERLDLLVVSFAEDVMTALRNVPLSEVMALSAGGRGTPAPKRKAAARSSRIPAKRSSKGVQQFVVVAERFFAERGTRGATEAQMRDAFEEQGVVLANDGGELVRVLLEREIIRDAGFRRATRNGLAPVFVLASLSR